MESSSGYGANPVFSAARAGQATSRWRAPIRLALVLKRFVEHPVVKLGVGLILIVSGLIEAYDTVLNDFHRLRVRVGHGVIILGVVNVLASLPEVIEGMNHWLGYLEQREEASQCRDGPDLGAEAKR
jgi:hypothetical protein